MKCLLPAVNAKILARAIQALGKVGDELYVESADNKLVFKTINAAESAFSSVSFEKCFFSYYGGDGGGFRVAARAVLSAFKSPANIDKRIDSCEIETESEQRIAIRLRCKQDIVKTYRVPALDGNKIDVTIPNGGPHSLKASARVFSDALDSLRASEERVTLDVDRRSLKLKDYAESDEPSSSRTRISIESAEFDTYNITTTSSVTFTAKEFRAALSFADALETPITLSFEGPGAPVILSVGDGTTFKLNLLLATERNEQPQHAVPEIANTDQVNRIQNVQSENRSAVPSAERALIETVFQKCFAPEVHSDDRLVGYASELL